MRKLYSNSLISLFVATSLSTFAANEGTPGTAWANIFDGKTSAGDQSIAVITATDGAAYWLNAGGSTQASPDIYYNNEKIMTGAESTGTSQTNNFCLIKTDAAGNCLWSVYSNSGDIDTGQGALALTSDGGVVFTVKMRHSDGMTDRDINFVNASGSNYSIDWKAENRYYRLMVGKINADGEIAWINSVEVDNSPAPAASGTNATFTANGFNIRAIATDTDDNIYLGGIASMAMTFPTAEGTAVVSPHNTDNWSGDPQGTCPGSLLLVKLDSKGDFIKAVETQSTAMIQETVNRLSFNNGTLYALGTLVGAGANAAMTVGDKTVNPSECPSVFVGTFDTDLNPGWTKCLAGGTVDGNKALQSMGLTVACGNIWICGTYNGTLSDGTNTVASTQGKLREGFIIKLDATDGKWLAAANSRDSYPASLGLAGSGLTGYLKVLQYDNDADNIYVYGYVMNANVGAFLRPYSAVTLTSNPDDALALVSQGGVPTAIDAVLDQSSKTVLATVRGNKAFQPLGSELTANPGTWAVLMAKFNIPGPDNDGIADIAATDNDCITVIAGAGCVTVRNSSDNDREITVFDICGRLVDSFTAAAGTETVRNLAKGYYIIDRKQTIVK